MQRDKSQWSSIRKEDILRLVEREEVLNNFLSSLTPTINTIKKLLQANYIDLYQQDKELIDDLLIDGGQVKELCVTNLKTIRNIRDGYTTIMQIRLNQIMKILTYITAIFTIPMVIASIYGMNMDVPLARHPQAFLILSVFTVFLVALAVFAFIFMRKKFDAPVRSCYHIGVYT